MSRVLAEHARNPGFSLWHYIKLGLRGGGRKIRGSKVIFNYVLSPRVPWDILDHRLSQQEKKKIITLIMCVYECSGVHVCMCVYRTEDTIGYFFSGTAHLSFLKLHFVSLFIVFVCTCA